MTKLDGKLSKIKKFYEPHRISSIGVANWCEFRWSDYEYLLRIAEAAEDFNDSLKGKTGAILGGQSFGKLDILRKALQGETED